MRIPGSEGEYRQKMPLPREKRSVSVETSALHPEDAAARVEDFVNASAELEEKDKKSKQKTLAELYRLREIYRSRHGRTDIPKASESFYAAQERLLDTQILTQEIEQGAVQQSAEATDENTRDERAA